MHDRLPPLTALRAFDAAARHLSFAKASDELHVTPAALSFQIKSLETHLGAPLFKRLNRAVELTEAGKALAPGASEGFASLSAAWRAALQTGNTQVLNVTAGPAFTAKWLAPRIYSFARDHPEVELRFAASLRMLDFRRDGIDVAIRFGNTHFDDLFSAPLPEEWLTPVMAPALAKAFPTPVSLLEAPLIVDESVDFLKPRCDWNAWFHAAGLGNAPTGGPRFSNADHALDAALSGAGVVLGRSTLVASDVLAGRLVAPYRCGLKTGARFQFLTKKDAEARPDVAALKDWIMRELAPTTHLRENHDLVVAGQQL